MRVHLSAYSTTPSARSTHKFSSYKTNFKKQKTHHFSVNEQIVKTSHSMEILQTKRKLNDKSGIIFY